MATIESLYFSTITTAIDKKQQLTVCIQDCSGVRRKSYVFNKVNAYASSKNNIEISCYAPTALVCPVYGDDDIEEFKTANTMFGIYIDSYRR
jgi:hypothetical protein